MPTPISYEEWKIKALDGRKSCKECNDQYKTTCDKCHGAGTIECHCCNHEEDCPDCDGLGEFVCLKCDGSASHIDYLKRVADDYIKLMAWRKLVMPETEIRKMASLAAKQACQQHTITRGAA